MTTTQNTATDRSRCPNCGASAAELSRHGVTIDWTGADSTVGLPGCGTVRCQNVGPIRAALDTVVAANQAAAAEKAAVSQAAQQQAAAEGLTGLAAICRAAQICETHPAWA